MTMADADHPSRRSCGTNAVHERLLRTVEGYADARAASENQALRAMASPFVGRTGCTEIPTVVHVVYKTNAQNISDAQIKSQIDVLNADFRKKNADVSTTPAVFMPLASDARVQFKLATTDPAGKATDGITRTKTTKDSFSHDDGVKSAGSGGADPWPADKYLNIWVCQLGGGLLGYAQFPGGPAATDGVVILHSGFGTTGTAAAPFNLGRTTTHEVGHWLNLRHIFGDDGTGCAGSDFVADTPNQGGPNFGVPTFPHVSCGNGPNGDMFMNYMDYVDDVAMVMFTAGQVTRMQATLDGFRSAIGHAIPCGIVKPIIKDAPKDPIKDTVKEPPKEGIKDFPKDPIKDKDFPKDPPKDKDIPKDPPHKDFPKDPPKDKDIPKDPPHKDFPKDPPKDKDFPKDPPHKEFPKDPPHKEFPKDPPHKEFIKEPIKDPIFDPPIKAFDVPPKGFDPQPGPGIPFVLATPGGGAGGGLSDHAAALASSWQTLLGHYSSLHERGLLDDAGQAAWSQAADAYQELARTMGA
jgi:pregnancy-associated plasma protein-A